MRRQWTLRDMFLWMLIAALIAYCVREHFGHYFNPSPIIEVIPADDL